jgi:nucleoside-diphosphate-sugar epimerase
MHALVTGGGGFLGRYIVEQLVARGDRVRAFGRREYPELAALGVEVVRGDLRDRRQTLAACSGVDTVFHVAGMAGIWGPWKQFHDINVRGTENVLAGCLLHRARRLVFTSSPSVTFDGQDQCGCDESIPYARRWLCHYPHTKAIAEQRVLAANTGGLLTCALRPHLIWGPRDGHLVPRLIERARTGRLRRVGDGSNRIDMVYVENAAAAHLQAADALKINSPVAGRAFFISQCEPVNCWQWIDQLLALAKLPPVARSISLAAAWRIGAALEVAYRLLPRRFEPPMTRFLAAQLGRSHYFDIRRAQTAFGYRAAISTSEGMERLRHFLATGAS